MDSRKRALVGESISRASVDAARGATVADIDAALAACDYERAATIAIAAARSGAPVDTAVIARILPGIELPAITCSLVAITPARAELLELIETQRFPATPDAGELEAIVLYAAWKAGADRARLILPVRRLTGRQLTAESYALLATIAASLDDANLAAATKPIAPFAKEYAKNVAADDKAMHASIEAVIAELPAEVEAAAAAGFTVRAGPQVGRNDPCPCGSGNKFKKCCADKPQAAPSPVAGLAWDAFLAGDRVTPEHIDELALRDVVRLDLGKLSDPALLVTLRRYTEAHEWEHAARVQAAATGREILVDLTDEHVRTLLEVGLIDRARPLIDGLPDDVRRAFALDLALHGGPELAYRTLVDTMRAALASDDELADVEIAYTLLRNEPVLGILAARACIGTLHVDDPEILLEAVEEARDALNLLPSDPAWDVLDTLRAKTKPGKATPTPADRDLAAAHARAAGLERTLEAVRAELAAAKTRPAAELMRAPDASGSASDVKLRELEGLIREGNAERRELRRQLEAREAEIEAARDRVAAAAPRPDDGDDEGDSLELGARDVTIPRFERRFVDALGEVPATVAAATMRLVGMLASGDGFTWRDVKSAKDMARQVLMVRVGIHHRLIFRTEDAAMEVLDLITREQLDTTLRRLRMNR